MTKNRDSWEEEFKKYDNPEEAMITLGHGIAAFLGQHVSENKENSSHLLAFVGCMAVLAKIYPDKKFKEEFVMQFTSMIHEFDPLIQLESEMYVDELRKNKKPRRRKKKKGEE